MDLKDFLMEKFLKPGYAYNIVMNTDGDIQILNDFINSKLKEQLEDRNEQWKTAIVYNVDAETWDRIREAMHVLEFNNLK